MGPRRVAAPTGAGAGLPVQTARHPALTALLFSLLGMAASAWRFLLAGPLENNPADIFLLIFSLLLFPLLTLVVLRLTRAGRFAHAAYAYFIPFNLFILLLTLVSPPEAAYLLMLIWAAAAALALIVGLRPALLLAAGFGLAGAGVLLDLGQPVLPFLLVGAAFCLTPAIVLPALHRNQQAEHAQSAADLAAARLELSETRQRLQDTEAHRAATSLQALRQAEEAGAQLRLVRAEADFYTGLAETLAEVASRAQLFRRAARLLLAGLEADRSLLYGAAPADAAPRLQAGFVRDRSGEPALPPDSPAGAEAAFPAVAAGQMSLHGLHDDGLDPAVALRLHALSCHWLLLVPLRDDDRLICLLALYRADPERPFSAAEQATAQRMGRFLLQALRGIDLARAGREQAAELGVRQRTVRLLAGADSLPELYWTARRELLALLEADGLAVYLPEPGQAGLHPAYIYAGGRDLPLPAPAALAPESLPGRVATSRAPLLRRADHEADLPDPPPLAFGSPPPAAWLGVPLPGPGQAPGVLAVWHAARPDAFGAGEQQLLAAFAAPFALSLQNQRLRATLQHELAAGKVQNAHLQAAAELAAVACGAASVPELAERAVTLVRERFDLEWAALDLLDSEGRAGEAGTRPPAEAAVTALPLIVAGRTIGTLRVSGAPAPPAAGTDVLALIGDVLAVAVNNARLMAEAQERARRQEFINQVSARMHRAHDVDAIVQIGLQALSEELAGRPVDLRVGRSAGTEPPADVPEP